MEDLKKSIIHWEHFLVCIQCTKPPDVVTRTAELLDEAGRIKEANLLRGQWVKCLFVVHHVVM